MRRAQLLRQRPTHAAPGRSAAAAVAAAAMFSAATAFPAAGMRDPSALSPCAASIQRAAAIRLVNHALRRSRIVRVRWWGPAPAVRVGRPCRPSAARGHSAAAARAAGLGRGACRGGGGGVREVGEDAGVAAPRS